MTNAGQPSGGRRFVVQRHRARRLHYDLRFEIDGVLVSWAVPRGPTLDPSVRHMAVHVEDHPVEYADFEGVIPAGEYGGGDVIVWDRGTWEPHGTDDPAAAVEAGELHAEMHGEKLRGRLVLVRRDKGRSRDGDKEEWLLLHKHDDHAEEGWDPEDHPQSVLSGRTNEEVAAAPDLLWHSDRPAAEAAEQVAWPERDRGRAGRACRPEGDRRQLGRLRQVAEGQQPRQGALPGPRQAEERSPSASCCATRPRSRRRCCPTCGAGR